jgi:hypothetical protein
MAPKGPTGLFDSYDSRQHASDFRGYLRRALSISAISLLDGLHEKHMLGHHLLPLATSLHLYILGTFLLFTLFLPAEAVMTFALHVRF